jgi:hypothetical protein
MAHSGYGATTLENNIMARFTIRLTGTTPLLTHNPRLADPEDEITREIAGITSKRKKTDEDRRAVARLEWFGGLYLSDDNRPSIPTANIHKCLIEAGKTRKLGKQIGRAVAFLDFMVPIVYDGPTAPDKLYQRLEFRHRATVVNNGRGRVVRVRPKFPAWGSIATVELLEDMLNPGDLREIASLAGMIEGLAEARTQGFGRFTAEVVAQ